MAIVCPDCPQDACCHFKPQSPDPYLKKEADMSLAKFGHLNHLVDEICCISDQLETLQEEVDAIVNEGPILEIIYCGVPLTEVLGTVTIPALEVFGDITGTGCAGDPLTVILPDVPITEIEYCGAPLVPVLGVITIPALDIEPVSATEALTGNGCDVPLSVCIDGTTITKDLNGCLQVANPFVPAGSACPYESNGDYPGIPLGRADTFALLSDTTLTIGLPAQIITGDIGYATVAGTSLIISGNSYDTASPQANYAAYAAGAITDATALHATLLAEVPTFALTNGTPLESDGPTANGVYTPGVYTKTGAIGTLAGANIVLDGAGCYVFVSTAGALATLANSTVTLINGAKASDVYWVAATTSDLAADNIWKGTLLSSGASSTGAHTTLEGRLISITGAVNTGAGAGAYFIPLS